MIYMYSELVKRLREHNGWALNKTLDEAADAIEELDRLLYYICSDNDHLCEKIGELSKERRAGKWKLAFTAEENVYECSECGEYWLLNDGLPYENKLFFCPTCGAPMEATTLKDILPDFPVKDIMIRVNSPYPTEDASEGYLDGYVSWDGEKLVSNFILEYSLDDKVVYYEWEDDGRLVCWMHTTWNNGWRERNNEQR